MKKFLALLLSAILLLSFTACKGKKDDDSTSKPVSEPSTSQDDNSQDDNSQGDNSQDNSSQGNNSQGNNSQGNNSQGNNSQGNNSQGNNSQGNNSQGNNSQGNNSQGGGQTPSVETTDLTVYAPYSANINENNVQYFPPTIGDDSTISPGLNVEGIPFEAPIVFEAKKAITAFKNESSSVTAAKLQEYVSKYATAYNKYYPKSNYKLAVSISGNAVKYTYTIIGEPAEKDNSYIDLVLKSASKSHFNKYADFYDDFYKDQIKSYKAAMSGISKIEVCIVRADNDPKLGKDNYSKNVLSKTYS